MTSCLYQFCTKVRVIISISQFYYFRHTWMKALWTVALWSPWIGSHVSCVNGKSKMDHNWSQHLLKITCYLASLMNGKWQKWDGGREPIFSIPYVLCFCQNYQRTVCLLNIASIIDKFRCSHVNLDWLCSLFGIWKQNLSWIVYG